MRSFCGKESVPKQNYFLNVNKINIGQYFKNYKTLCKYLGQPVLFGNSKKSQIKEWQRYFEFVKKGQKIEITKVYKRIKQKSDNRIFNGKPKYSNLIENILMYYYNSNYKTTSCYINLTSSQIYLICGMINPMYEYGLTHQKLKNENLDEFNIRNFIFRTRNKLNAIISSALNSMKKRDVLDFGKIVMISENGVHRTANKEESVDIIQIENNVLNSFQSRNISEIILSGRYNSYCKKVKKEIRIKLHLDYIYRGYYIKFYKFNSKRNYTKQEYMDMKLELSKNIIDYFNNQAKNKELLHSQMNTEFNLPKNYYSEQIKLAELFLKIK